MMDTLPRLTNGVITYMEHRLRAKVQFSEIRKVTDDLKGQDMRVLVVIDHKQKILLMKYRDGQVEYFVKRVIPILGSMAVWWVEDSFMYSFILNLYSKDIVDNITSKWPLNSR